MILAFVELERDRIVPSSFGYQRLFWDDSFTLAFSHATPMLGLPIEIETTFNPKLRKLISYYCLRTGSVVVECLGWAFNNLFYPYRAKYIGVDGQSRHLRIGKSYLFLPNMATIHKRLTNMEVAFSSPLNHCLETTLHDYKTGHFTPMREEFLSALKHRYQNQISGVCEQEGSSVRTDHMLEFQRSLDHDSPLEYIERMFVRNIVPKIPITDSISNMFWNRPMRISSLYEQRPNGQPFDISPPSAISINHPNVTCYSPKDYHKAASAFEDISYDCTDLKVEYISLDRSTLNQHVCYLVSRYVAGVDTKEVLKSCFTLVCQVLEISGFMKRRNWGQNAYELLCDLIAVVQLSYGDEAVVEIYTKDRSRCLHAVHLDLALLALTSSNVIAETPI